MTVPNFCKAEGCTRRLDSGPGFCDRCQRERGREYMSAADGAAPLLRAKPSPPTQRQSAGSCYVRAGDPVFYDIVEGAWFFRDEAEVRHGPYDSHGLADYECERYACGLNQRRSKARKQSTPLTWILPDEDWKTVRCQCGAMDLLGDRSSTDPPTYVRRASPYGRNEWVAHYRVMKCHVPFFSDDILEVDDVHLSMRQWRGKTLDIWTVGQLVEVPDLFEGSDAVWLLGNIQSIWVKIQNGCVTCRVRRRHDGQVGHYLISFLRAV
jgi:hypothetical protein